MNLVQFKNRELDKFLVAVFVIKTEVQIETEERVRKRDMYLFIGMNEKGKRKYLTHGIDYNEDTEFWIQKFKNISRRGVEKIIYLLMDNVNGKRAAQITFPGVKISTTPFLIIEKVSPYFADTYKNKMPEEIRKLYICRDKEEYKRNVSEFMYRYEEKKIVTLLIEKDIKDIEKVYEISHNIRRLIFPFYFIRDYKKWFKREMNKKKIIKNADEFILFFEELLESWEKIMYVTKNEWMEILNELIETNEEIVRYL